MKSLFILLLSGITFFSSATLERDAVALVEEVQKGKKYVKMSQCERLTINLELIHTKSSDPDPLTYGLVDPSDFKEPKQSYRIQILGDHVLHTLEFKKKQEYDFYGKKLLTILMPTIKSNKCSLKKGYEKVTTKYGHKHLFKQIELRAYDHAHKIEIEFRER